MYLLKSLSFFSYSFFSKKVWQKSDRTGSEMGNVEAFQPIVSRTNECWTKRWWKKKVCTKKRVRAGTKRRAFVRWFYFLNSFSKYIGLLRRISFFWRIFFPSVDSKSGKRGSILKGGLYGIGVNTPWNILECFFLFFVCFNLNKL